MPHEIFISYSHRDKTTADAICSHLESRGMRCWYAPRDITPGDEWGNAILKGIENARIMVLIFTRDANLSQQVLREVNNAVNAGLSIIPFRLTEEEPAAGMRYYLSTVHWMDAMNDELEQSIASLGDLCKAVLEKRAVPPTKPGNRMGEDKTTGTPVPEGKKKKGLILAAAAILIAAVGILAAILFSGRGDGETEAQEAAVSSADAAPAATETGAVSSSAEAAATETETASAEPVVVTFEGEDPEDRTDISHEEATEEIPSSPVTADNVTDDFSVSYTDGNNQGNILNGGHLAFDGEWYYYTGNDGGRMHRMKADGSREETLTDIPASCISVYEGRVYFVSDAGELFRMEADGSDLTSLVPYGADYARIQNGRIYYGESGLSSVALDGSDERVENEIDGYDVLIDGTYTYYIDPSNGRHLYRANLDGSDAVCVLNRSVTSLRIAGNRLFFYDDDNGWASSYNINTGEILQLTNDPINAPVITKDGIYGGSGRLQIIYVPLDRVGVKVLTDGWADTVNVAGEKIFYRNGDDDQYYMMDLDGSNKTKL